MGWQTCANVSCCAGHQHEQDMNRQMPDKSYKSFIGSKHLWLVAMMLLSLGGSMLIRDAAAQSYPNKPITVVVPFAAGTSTDTACRLFNQGAQDALKQTLVTENRPGGSAVTGTMYVTKAAPDGYTLLCLGGGSVSKTFNKPCQ